MKAVLMLILLLAGGAYAATVPSETFKAAISAAGNTRAADDAKKAQADAKSAQSSAASAAAGVADTAASLEQWQTAIKAATEAIAQKAANDQSTNQRLAFWGIVVNAFGVLVMGVLVWIWKRLIAKVSSEINNLPEVIKQLSLLGPVIIKLEENTNSINDRMVALEKEKSHDEGLQQGIAQEKERSQK